MKYRYLVVILSSAIFCSTAFAELFTVTVKVLDANKNPVAKAGVSTFWMVKDGVMTVAAEKPIITNAAGKAVLRVDDWNEKRPVLVLSADCTRGAIVGVSKADDGKEVTVTLGPTVRVKGKMECKELSHPPTWANTMVTVDGFRPYFVQNITESASFEFVLPAGSYKLGSYGADVIRVSQSVTLTSGEGVKDLGTIDMKASEIAKLRGKPLPDWVIADARGVKADVKLSDYRGKWLLVEFWGWWCGPCVAGSLPELIGLYEDHAGDRDKFAIIAVHERNAKTFADVDNRLPRIKEQYWQNKDLPFPVLLDVTGKTAELYSISGYPTGLLIDPEGKLVGMASAHDLEAKLPPLPMAKQWAHHRDLYKNVMWTFEPSKTTVTQFANLLKRFSNCPIELDPEAVKACGLDPQGPLPGVVVGVGSTMRSIEELLLAPHGLGIVPSPDGKKLLITKHQSTKDAESYFQKLHFREINKRLDLGASAADIKNAKPLQIKDLPLIDAIKLIFQEFEVPIALDAKAMRTKMLDPKAKVSGSIGPGNLRQSLTKLLEPLGLMIEVRDEVVLMTPKEK